MNVVLRNNKNMFEKDKMLGNAQKKIDYSWGEFDQDVGEILSWLEDNPDYKTIVAIAYGSLPLLTCIKNAYPELEYHIVHASSYDNETQRELVISQFNAIFWAEPILLIDEIVDTGYTMTAIKKRLEEQFKEVKTFSLFYKPHSIYKPDYFLYKVDSHLWVNMPWG